jgi:hypothetical protein
MDLCSTIIARTGKKPFFAYLAYYLDCMQLVYSKIWFLILQFFGGKIEHKLEVKINSGAKFLSSDYCMLINRWWAALTHFSIVLKMSPIVSKLFFIVENCRPISRRVQNLFEFFFYFNPKTLATRSKNISKRSEINFYLILKVILSN